MKKLSFIVLLAVLLGSLAGCGTETPPSEQPTASTKPSATEPPASGLVRVELLSADEQAAVQDFLNKMENNGFVGSLNFYDAPEEVSLEWVLYDGAGVGEWVSDWDEAEKQALLSAGGWEELYVGVMKYPAAAVKQLVQEKLGTSMEKLKKPFEYIYLEAYDAYYHMHSDTNYLPVTVVDGSRSADGVYYVQYRDTFDPHSLYKVTLRKTENGYQFISNQLI